MREDVNLDRIISHINTLKSIDSEDARIKCSEYVDKIRDETHSERERGRITWDEEYFSFIKLGFKALEEDFLRNCQNDFIISTPEKKYSFHFERNSFFKEFLDINKERIDSLLSIANQFIPQEKLILDTEEDLSNLKDLFTNYEVLDKFEDGWFNDLIIKYNSKDNIYLSHISECQTLAGLSIKKINDKWHKVKGIYILDIEEKVDLKLLNQYGDHIIKSQKQSTAETFYESENRKLFETHKFKTLTEEKEIVEYSRALNKDIVDISGEKVTWKDGIKDITKVIYGLKSPKLDFSFN